MWRNELSTVQISCLDLHIWPIYFDGMKVFCQKIYTKKHSVEITVIGYFLMVISDFFNMRSKDWPLEKAYRQFLKTKSLFTTPSNVLPLNLKQTFPPTIWIFTEGEGDGIESRLPLEIFSTLMTNYAYFLPKLVLTPQKKTNSHIFKILWRIHDSWAT